MSAENTPLGSIHVSPKAIATIAYYATLESYGVVGLSSKNLVDGWAQAVVKDPTHGVHVDYDGQDINIDPSEGHSALERNLPIGRPSGLAGKIGE